MLKKTLILLTGLFLLSACGAKKDQNSGDMETLKSWMTGSFSSAAQAAADSAFFDIRLEMCPIWPENPDGPWLYVEQAAADYLDQPYRQRVYRLEQQEDGTIHSEVYSFEQPLRFAGAWKNERPLAALTPDSLLAREGCAVVLKRVDENTFAGSTVERACVSKHRGASYATSEVTVSALGIVSWDRGYDADGEQVWGAVKGGYVFDKVKK